MTILDECWIWGGAKDGSGYGMKYLGTDSAGKEKYSSTHRLAWAWANSSWDENGPHIPAGMHVLHKCDNPPCCNPNHLKLGTPHENSLDMKAKRRSAGARDWRKTCRNGHAVTEGSIYYHTQAGGRRIRKCRECDKDGFAVYRRSSKKDLPPDVEAFAFLAKHSELSQAQIAEHYKVSKATVARWCRDYGAKTRARRGRGAHTPSVAPALVPIF